MMRLMYVGLLVRFVASVRTEDKAEGEDGVEFEDDTIYK